MNPPGGDSFDQWLGQQLQQHASANAGPSPMPAQAQYQASFVGGAVHVPFLAKVAAVLGTKAAMAVAAGALAVGAASAGEAVITGSFNPGDWGQQVVQQVNTCKDALAPDSHGIGDCVSSFASQHGKTVSSEHRATPTTTPSHGPAHTPGAPVVVHPTPPGKTAHATPANSSKK
jgi:uncharacterized membrane protein YebE (DUF533 family)